MTQVRMDGSSTMHAFSAEITGATDVPARDFAVHSSHFQRH